MRAVLDPNVIISALLSPEGAPARTLREWLHGGFELVVSSSLLEELRRALDYPKLRKRIEPEEAERVVAWLRRLATMAADPDRSAPIRSPDPGDEYLIALAEAERAVLVSGDQHLLGLSERLPIFSAGGSLDLLEKGPGSKEP